MNALSFLVTIVLCVFLFIAPRRLFLLPFIIAVCIVPMNQRIIFFDLDFTLLRLLIIVSILRLTMMGETIKIQWNMFDKLMLSWILIGSVVYIIQQASFGAVIYKLGFIVDSLGMYWLFRQVLRDWESLAFTVKIFAIFAVVTAPLIAMETQEYSFFSNFGPTVGSFHRDRFRAAGAFPHYIILGCFWATLLPFFYAQIKINKNKLLNWMAILASLSNVIFSASSTPFMTVGSIIIFWQLYSYRKHGKAIFWGTCCTLILLHLIMKAPVWHLMARVNIFGGSTGFHRYFLFNNFVNHVSEWFVLGTKSTAHWGHAQTDLTNQFVLEGVRGGMITLMLFIMLIYNAVKISGKYSLNSVIPQTQWISWGICVAILGHFVTFWGVSYFGQINMLLYFAFSLVGFIQEQSSNESFAITLSR